MGGGGCCALVPQDLCFRHKTFVNIVEIGLEGKTRARK